MLLLKTSQGDYLNLDHITRAFDRGPNGGMELHLVTGQTRMITEANDLLRLRYVFSKLATQEPSNG